MNPAILGMVAGFLLAFILAGGIMLAKSMAGRGKALIIGQDPRGGPSMILKQRLRDGSFTFKRRNGRSMDVKFPEGFLDPTPKGQRVGFFDLATGEPFRISVKKDAPPEGPEWEAPNPEGVVRCQCGDDATCQHIGGKIRVYPNGEKDHRFKTALADWKKRVGTYTERLRVDAHHYWELGQVRAGDVFFRSMEGPWGAAIKLMPWLFGIVIVFLMVLGGMVWKLSQDSGAA